MKQRKYSISELDQMREAIGRLMFDGAYDDIRDPHGRIEDRLRTYMLNGTGLDEIEAAIEDKRQERVAARRAALVRFGLQSGNQVLFGKVR